MDTQTLLNIAFGLVAFFGGIWVRGIADSLKDLKSADSELASKVQNIELLVAGTYVKRDELEKLGQAIFVKLDKIESKLDHKADK
jgi:hypothetical protein